MSSNFIIDVNEINFEYEVISYSQNTLVLVDFWASWCKPCLVISPLLELLATEAQGAFRLAKVDIDHNPNLAIHYNVRSIPTIKAFRDGVVIAELVGPQPEIRLREFISKLSPPSTINLSLEKATSLLLNHEWTSAEDMFREILDTNPENPAALLGLAKSLLVQANASEAIMILNNFPDSPEFSIAEKIIPLAQSMINLSQNNLPDETDLDATFQNSIRLVSKNNLIAALDGLLDILRQDKHYRKDIARQVILAILELLGEEDPSTRQYRAELASVLF